MGLPFFYLADHDRSLVEVQLDEDTSRHVVQVLRMKKGDRINLTDGKGSLFTCSIIDDHKKHCICRIDETVYQEPSPKKISIGISLIKNTNRFEWFLEKATEIGVNEIIPLVCERTEKEKFRSDRLTGILVSAMLQSQQTWLPVLHQPLAYELLFRQEEVVAMENKFIAHCLEGESGRMILPSLPADIESRSILLIGPEGDFTAEEIILANNHGFMPVSLGENRLRTETAGVVGLVMMRG